MGDCYVATSLSTPHRHDQVYPRTSKHRTPPPLPPPPAHPQQNRQGKTRLSKWYAPYDDDEKVSPVSRTLALIPFDYADMHTPRSDYADKYTGSSPRETKSISPTLSRCVQNGTALSLLTSPLRFHRSHLDSLLSQLGLVQFRDDKVIYRRYAGLFFCVCVDSNDNELAYLEAIHLFVEVLGEFLWIRRAISGSQDCYWLWIGLLLARLRRSGPA